MPDTPHPRAAVWRRAIHAQSERRGVALSPDVVDELLTYLEDLDAAMRREGVPDRDIARAVDHAIAHARYDDLAATRRGRRLVRANGSFADLLFDVRYTMRAARRRVTFTAAIVVILAVGIGATVAAYAVIDAVLLRPLPYPEHDRLVVLSHGVAPNESRSFSPADWRDYAARASAVAPLAAWASWPMNLSGTGDPERLRSFLISGDFFAVAGTPPALGRLATVADDRPSAPAVAVLSDGFWRRRFGASPGVIGTTVQLNGQTVTIIGVMPPAFALPDPRADLWMPMGLAPAVLNDRAGEWLSLIGRLQPDASIDEARAELSTIAAQLAAAYPRPHRDVQIGVTSLLDAIVGGVRRPLWLGGLAALFVLLAGLANAANLMLAAATARQDEMAIRASLGANASRLARQLLTESLVLAIAGGLLGALLSVTFLGAFTMLAQDAFPRAASPSIEGRAVMVAMAICLGSAAVVGGVAAWRLVRGGTPPLLHGSPHRLTRPLLAQELFLGLQVAFALMLITGEIDIATSYARTLGIDPGFDNSNTLTFQLTLPRRRYPDSAAQQRFVSRALDALSAEAGVTSVGVVSDLPFVANATHFPVVRVGQPVASARMMTVRLADPGFFRTTRIPLIAGRAFDPTDRADTPPVAMLNASAARAYGGVTETMTDRLVVSGDEQHPRAIVGIVGDIKHAGLHVDEGPVLYIPYAQKPFDFLNWMGMVVRTFHDPLSAARVQAAIGSVDPDQPVEALQTMDDYLRRETAPYRFGSLVIGSLAMTTFLLALTGVHGLAAFVIGRRARELAVRRALGAPRRSILRHLTARLGVIVSTGAAAGIVGSLVTNRLLRAAFPASASLAGTTWHLPVTGIVIAVIASAVAVWPSVRLVQRMDGEGFHLNQE